MDPQAFEFVVPVNWTLRPYEPGSIPTGWMGPEGRVVKTAEEAVTFRFRLYPTMKEEALIQRELDTINGGIDKTTDLDNAITSLYADVRSRYEGELWPEGRPKPQSQEEADEQEALIQGLWDMEGEDRRVMERMQQLQALHMVAAEWAHLGIELPPYYRDIASLPMPRARMDAFVTAYRRAKLRKEEETGK